MTEGKLIALWEAGKHPRDWYWLRLRSDGRALHVYNEKYRAPQTFEASGWMLAREHDGVEAEVYVPCI